MTLQLGGVKPTQPLATVLLKKGASLLMSLNEEDIQEDDVDETALEVRLTWGDGGQQSAEVGFSKQQGSKIWTGTLTLSDEIRSGDVVAVEIGRPDAPVATSKFQARSHRERMLTGGIWLLALLVAFWVNWGLLRWLGTETVAALIGLLSSFAPFFLAVLVPMFELWGGLPKTLDALFKHRALAVGAAVFALLVGTVVPFVFVRVSNQSGAVMELPGGRSLASGDTLSLASSTPGAETTALEFIDQAEGAYRWGQPRVVSLSCNRQADVPRAQLADLEASGLKEQAELNVALKPEHCNAHTCRVTVRDAQCAPNGRLLWFTNEGGKYRAAFPFAGITRKATYRFAREPIEPLVRWKADSEAGMSNPDRIETAVVTAKAGEELVLPTGRGSFEIDGSTLLCDHLKATQIEVKQLSLLSPSAIWATGTQLEAGTKTTSLWTAGKNVESRSAFFCDSKQEPSRLLVLSKHPPRAPIRVPAGYHVRISAQEKERELLLRCPATDEDSYLVPFSFSGHSRPGYYHLESSDGEWLSAEAEFPPKEGWLCLAEREVPSGSVLVESRVLNPKESKPVVGAESGLYLVEFPGPPSKPFVPPWGVIL